MADNQTMAQLLQAPTKGYGDAIVIPEINANFELKHGLINLVQNKQFFGHDKEDPHAHIRYFKKITSTMRFSDIPSTSIKLMIFPFSLEGSAQIWLEKEPPQSILTWDDLVSKFINQFFLPSKTTNLRNEITRFQQRFDESFYEAWDQFNDLLRACPHHGFLELHQLDTFYNALKAKDQDSLNSVAGENFLDKMLRECLKIIESKSKVHNLRNKAVIAKVSSNSSTPEISPDVAALTTEVSELKNMMKTMLIDKQKAQAPAPVKAVEQSCVTCGGAHSYRNCPATDGNVYRDNIQEYVSQAAAANFNQGNTNSRPPMVSNQIRPPGKYAKIKPRYSTSNVTNPREHVNAITTRSGKTCEGPSTPFVPTSVVSIPLKEPERNPETSMDKVQKPSSENTAQVPPPEDHDSIFIPKPKAKETVQEPISLDPNLYQPKLPYPERMKVREKDTPSAQQSRFMKLFKQLRLEIGLRDALIEMPKFNKWTNALADFGASINILPHSIYKQLGLGALKPTRMTLELANRSVTHPMGITKDVVVRVDGETFPSQCKSFYLIFMRKNYTLSVGSDELVFYADKSEKSKNKKFAHAISVIDFSKDEPFSGSTTIHSDALPPSSSPVKTSDNLEEFADELTLLDSFPPGNDDSVLKKAVHKENFQVYSNPLFEFDDNFNSSNVNPLFNEKDEDDENENSNVSNSDEPVFLNTPLSDKVECSDPEDDIDEIDAFLAMEVSFFFFFLLILRKVIMIRKETSDPLHHEFAGEIITLPSRIAREHKEYLSLMNLLCEISTSQSPKSVENDDSEDEDNSTFLPEHESPNLDHQDNPSAPRPPPEPPDVKIRLEPDTAVINNFDVLNKEACFNLEEGVQIFLPFFTYPEDSPFILSFGSEDLVFDPGIFIFHFSYLESVVFSMEVSYSKYCSP
ncbi:reverse transcriptase domain-containing protein [Tanacetum coccineum]